MDTAPPSCGHCTTQLWAMHHPAVGTAPPSCGHCTTQLWALYHSASLSWVLFCAVRRGQCWTSVFQHPLHLMLAHSSVLHHQELAVCPTTCHLLIQSQIASILGLAVVRCGPWSGVLQHLCQLAPAQPNPLVHQKPACSH